MGYSISSTAFDVGLVARDDLDIWTSRGYVSADSCGFDVFVNYQGAAPGDLDRFLRGVLWWDTESLEATLRPAVTCDGVSTPLTLVGGAGGTRTDEHLRLSVSMEFPTPDACSSLVLTMDAEPWTPPVKVELDATELASSLQRWRLAHAVVERRRSQL